MIPIHILGGLKSIPHSSRTSVYTFIMEVTPPWVGCSLHVKYTWICVIRPISMHNWRSTRQQRLQKEEITRNRSDDESLSFRSITKIAAIHNPHTTQKITDRKLVVCRVVDHNYCHEWKIWSWRSFIKSTLTQLAVTLIAQSVYFIDHVIILAAQIWHFFSGHSAKWFLRILSHTIFIKY